jgi:REP element-mobilizing transposase RayT
VTLTLTKVREHLRRFDVALLDYCITSNHVHLLVDAEERLEVSGLMREVASEFARACNRRKGRSDAFWGDNYHATLVEDGPYLWRCVCYIELNMVRCGVVAHPVAGSRIAGVKPLFFRIALIFLASLFTIPGCSVPHCH